MDLQADHKRPRFWLLGVCNERVLNKVYQHLCTLPKFRADFWLDNPHEIVYPAEVSVLTPQKRGVGNVQAPIAVEIAFRILAERLYKNNESTNDSIIHTDEEVNSVFIRQETWIQSQNLGYPIFVHTPTTMGNYHYKSMMKHPSCTKYVRIFGKLTALHAEYLMGFPIGVSSTSPMKNNNYQVWKEKKYCRFSEDFC